MRLSMFFPHKSTQLSSAYSTVNSCSDKAFLKSRNNPIIKSPESLDDVILLTNVWIACWVEYLCLEPN